MPAVACSLHPGAGEQADPENLVSATAHFGVVVK